jgi:hypothetical protein
VSPLARIACLTAFLLIGTAPGRATAADEPFGAPSGEPEIVADFDRNGLTDRIDHGNVPHRPGIRIRLNGGEPRLLAAVAVRRLVVLDFDRDNDEDVVALAADGRLMLWRNQGGTLDLVSPNRGSPRAGWTSATGARTPETACAEDRHGHCLVSGGHAGNARPGIVQSFAALRHLERPSYDPSSPRAPPLAGRSRI